MSIHQIAPKSDKDLILRAKTLWPNSPKNQEAWIRAIEFLRSGTTSKWLSDKRVGRIAATR